MSSLHGLASRRGHECIVQLKREREPLLGLHPAAARGGGGPQLHESSSVARALGDAPLTDDEYAVAVCSIANPVVAEVAEVAVHEQQTLDADGAGGWRYKRMASQAGGDMFGSQLHRCLPLTSRKIWIEMRALAPM